jgi:hypothetical protein
VRQLLFGRAPTRSGTGIFIIDAFFAVAASAQARFRAIITSGELLGRKDSRPGIENLDRIDTRRELPNEITRRSIDQNLIEGRGDDLALHRALQYVLRRILNPMGTMDAMDFLRAFPSARP